MSQCKRFVLLASYPKSGNTWFRAGLSSILTNGDPVDINKIGFRHCAEREFCDSALGIQSSDLTKKEMANLRPHIYRDVYQNSNGDVIYKVHDAWLRPFAGGVLPFPADIVSHVIYIVRDPRDVAVSFANHIGQTVSRTISLMNKPNNVLANSSTSIRLQLPQLLSTWSNHVKSWIDTTDFSVHVMRYEDLSVDPQREFRNALHYLGLEVPASSVNRAVEAVRFEKLKAQEEQFGFVERSSTTATFFRSGRVNGWRESMSDKEARQLECDHAVVMARLGYLGS